MSDPSVLDSTAVGRSARRGPLLAALLAICLVLGACSSMTGIAYNNAVTLGAWYIDDYFGLNEDQRDQVRTKLTRILAWHRANELPAYQRALDDAIAQVGKPRPEVTPASVAEFYQLGRRFAERAGEQMLGDAADLLLSLDADQLRALEQKMHKDNEKFERERIALAADKRQQKRLERYLDSVESWFGSVTREQRSYIEQALLRTPANDEYRMQERKRLRAETLALIRMRPPREVLVAKLRVTVVRPDLSRTPEYQAEMTRWQAQSAATVAWLINNATPDQRAHLGRKLQGYADQISSLRRS